MKYLTLNCASHLISQNKVLTKQECLRLLKYINDHCIIVWSPEDFDEVAPHLTNDQRIDALKAIEDNHDANIGITWDTLAYQASMYNQES